MIDGQGEDTDPSDGHDSHGTLSPAQLLAFDGGTPGDPGAERHHVLRQLRQQLELHPGVEAAWGTPGGAFSAVEARIDPAYFGRGADTATLRVVWQPTPDDDPGDRPSDPGDPSKPGPRTAFVAMFRVHYSESGGFDCGFHNEPNPHVDGWFHVQWRASPGEAYDYRPASLEARTPVGALWEILEELESILRSE